MASDDDFDAPQGDSAPQSDSRSAEGVEPGSDPDVSDASEGTDPVIDGDPDAADTEDTDDTTDPEAGDDSDEPEAAEAADEPEAPAPVAATFGLIFQAPDPEAVVRRATRPVRETPHDDDADDSQSADDDEAPAPSSRRRGRTRRSAHGERPATSDDDSTDSDASAESDSDDSSDSGDSDQGADDTDASSRRSRRRGGRGRRRPGGADSSSDTDAAGDSADSHEASESSDDSDGDAGDSDSADDSDAGADDDSSTSRRRTRRRRRSGSTSDAAEDPPGTVTRVREPRRESSDTATGIRGSTRLEAKRQRRRDGREAGRRRTIITEAQFLARRESVERIMAIREIEGRTEIGVLEDDVLVEHYISGSDGGSGGSSGATSVGNVYLGRVQNVLPSMEAAFVDIGKGRNAVLYAGEVNWDAAGLEANSQRRIENALTSGQSVLVQVTKDPIGHKGARLTSQVSLPGRFLVYVPDGSMTGISRKLPDTERTRLKALLKKIVPENAGVIVRTAAEGATEEELTADVERLARQWERIQKKAGSGGAPVLLHGEPGLTVRVVRDVFNEDFSKLVVAGSGVWETVSDYVESVAPDLMERVEKWTGSKDLFAHYRIDEQLAKAMDRKVWLPSGGSLVIDRTEAMTVIDVNTGKFTGSGGNLEETVTKNNLEAAEEIVNQLRLRDIGGIIVVDFIDMVLESNRDLVVRRLVECLGRDRTKHQVAEVTSLGLVQMTRKRVGSGLIEVFSDTCEHCSGRGIIVHDTPRIAAAQPEPEGNGRRGRRTGSGNAGGGTNRRGDNGRSDARDNREAQGRDENDKQDDRKGPSAAAMAAIAAAAKNVEAAVEAEAAARANAPGSVEADTVAEAIETAGDSVAESGGGASSEAVSTTEPTPAPTTANTTTRRGRRGGRRAASAPAGVELSSVGLMTASADNGSGAPDSAPLTQVAGDATVSASSVSSGAAASSLSEASEAESPSEQGDGEAAAAAPASAASTSRRRPRRRAGAPAGPPTGPDDN